MANLAEQAIYEPAIYELATTDPLLGGAGGQLNIAAQQLANRTAFLHAAINALQTALQNAGKGNVTAADIAAAINAHLAAADPHPQYTTVAEVTTLIASNAPAAPVSSVAGKTGAVTLTPADASAEPANANIQAHISTPHQPMLTLDDAVNSSILKSAVDANTIKKSGFYSGYGANWPMQSGGIQWVYMQVQMRQPLYGVQFAYSLFVNRSFKRLLVNNVWGAWISSDVPIGSVIAHAGATPPDGFFECNGAAASRIVFSELFTAIGILYGTGNGTTTFNIPDLRGEFVRGWDHAKGVDAGRGLGSWQADMFKSHTHTYLKASGGGAISNAATFGWTQTLTNTSATGGAETRPRNVALMYCIKY